MLKKYWTKFRYWVILLLIVSFSAQIGTMGFTAYHFARIPLVGVLLNLIAIPVAGLIVSGTIVGLSISLLFPGLGRLIGDGVGMLVTVLEKTVHYGNQIPGASIQTPSWDILFSLFFYLGVFSIIFWKNKIMRNLFVFGAFAICLHGIWTPLFIPEKLNLTFLDVGFGDATVVQFPTGDAVVIDCGKITRYYDDGEKTLLPFFEKYGLGEIQILVLTSANKNNYGGAISLLKALPVGEIWVLFEDMDQPGFQHLKEIASEKEIPIIFRQKGDYDAKYGLYVLQVGSAIWKNSSVMRLQFGEKSVLFYGNYDRFAIPEEFKNHIVADIFKTPNHGQDSTFLRILPKIAPQISIVTTKIAQKIDENFVEKLENCGEVLLTGETGAVMFETDGKTFRRIDWRKL